MTFDGDTYDPAYDSERLDKQLGRVYACLRDRQWRTIDEIRAWCFHECDKHDSPTGISARIRDLRKAKFGGYTLESRRRGDPKNGLWEYRMLDSVLF